MGEVKLVIQGKAYPIACDTGQEQRVAALGRYLDAQVAEIARAGAATEENHLLVLTGLILTDRIDELQGALDHAASARPSLPPAPEQIIVEVPVTIEVPVETAQRVSEDDEAEILAAIEQLAGRLGLVAERLQKA